MDQVQTQIQIQEVKVMGEMVSVADVVAIVERPSAFIESRHSFYKVVDALPAILALLGSEEYQEDVLVLQLREVMGTHRAALVKHLNEYLYTLEWMVKDHEKEEGLKEQNETYKATARRIQSFLKYFES